MTNQNQNREWIGMMAVGLVAVPLVLVGCKEEAPPPPPPAPVDVPPPPPPQQADVVALLQEMGADKRVQFPEDIAPVDVEYARSIITLANSFASGDEEGFRSMLDMTGQQTLDGLVEDGSWYDATDRIEAVRVVYLTEPLEDDGSNFGDGDVEVSGDTELTPEAMRDQLLQEIKDQGYTTVAEMMADSFSMMGDSLPVDEQYSPEMAEQIGEQFAEAFLGAELVAELKQIEEEFKDSQDSPEDFVNEMYERGTLARISDRLMSAVASMGAAMQQMGDAMFGSGSGGAELRIAIQEPGAAYALSFTAIDMGGRFVFAPAPDTNVVRARVTDFTGASAGLGDFYEGLEGFDVGGFDPGGSPGQRPSDSSGFPGSTPPPGPTSPSSPPSSPGG